MSEHHKRARNVPSGQDAARHRGDLEHGKSPAINASIEARIPTADEARKKLEAIPLPSSEVLEPALKAWRGADAAYEAALDASLGPAPIKARRARDARLSNYADQEKRARCAVLKILNPDCHEDDA